MKRLKSAIVFILTVALALTVVSCGKEEETVDLLGGSDYTEESIDGLDENDGTDIIVSDSADSDSDSIAETEKLVNVIEELNIPQSKDSNSKDIAFTIKLSDESMSMKYRENDDKSYLIYVDLGENSIIYEINPAGIATGTYLGDNSSGSYEKSKITPQEAQESIKSYNSILALLYPETLSAEASFEESGSTKTPLGTATVYKGDIGKYYVDDKTGFAVAYYDADGNTVFEVTELSTSDVEFPDYKS